MRRLVGRGSPGWRAGMTDRDFVTETAEVNARVRDLVYEPRRRADEAIEAGDAGELTIALRETLALLEAVAEDLSESRADGATEYLRNPEFRRVVDQAQGEQIFDQCGGSDRARPAERCNAGPAQRLHGEGRASSRRFNVSTIEREAVSS